MCVHTPLTPRSNLPSFFVVGNHDGDFVCMPVGESSGKVSRSLATYTPGPAGMAYAQEAGTSAVSDIARAKMVCNAAVLLYRITSCECDS